MNLVIEDTVRDKSLNTTLLSVFAGVSLLLALIGVYGVMSYTVAQHTRDIGIRIALGAQPGSILKLILGRGFVLRCDWCIDVVWSDTFYREHVVWSYPNRSADVCNDRDPARIRCPPRLPDSSHTRTACRSDRRPAPHVSTK
jgi:hypothetical protein